MVQNNNGGGQQIAQSNHCDFLDRSVLPGEAKRPPKQTKREKAKPALFAQPTSAERQAPTSHPIAGLRIFSWLCDHSGVMNAIGFAGLQGNRPIVNSKGWPCPMFISVIWGKFSNSVFNPSSLPTPPGHLPRDANLAI